MDGVGLTIFFTAGMANLGQLPFLCAISLSIYLRQRKSGHLHGLYLGHQVWHHHLRQAPLDGVTSSCE